MEFVGAILQLVKFISAPIGKCWKYCWGLDKIKEILKSDLEELNCRKGDVELRLSADLRSGKKLPMKEVEYWLDKVAKINDETQDIEKQVGERRCLSRARLGKLVDKKIQEVKELYQKCHFPNGLVVDAPPSSGITLPTTTLVGETTKICMSEILEYLMGDEIRKIGVCGMGGIGKTTIMKHIYNQLRKEKKKFDDVIWVTVSKEFDVIKLQNDIARVLDLELPKCDDKIIRAGELFGMLEKKKRYVLILDDMWEAFSLEDVGIPEPTSTNGCKLVLTTRSLDVCHSIDCTVVEVGVLTDVEAWKLFSDIVGHDVLRISALEPFVKLVAKECACLPLAIVMIAGSMKKKYDISEWRNALTELRERLKGVKGKENEVFERLKFSYDHLKDLKVQKCFLYCALYPEDYEIKKRVLIECWSAEGLMDEMTSREAEFDRGHVILHTLENSNLLEKSSTRLGFVKMHDLVRDMALNITRGSPRFMVKANMQLNELPNEQEWMEDVEKVSLMGNNISEIPSDMSPKCQRLETLLLQGNYNLKSISNSFFVHMLGLKVLYLSSTGIEILPDNISNLKHLIALLLRNCSSLKYMPSLAALKALRKLDLMYSGIKEVPQGMEMLVNLRCLNLGGTHSNLKMLPTGILPKLSRLQCLIVAQSPSKTLNVKAEEVGSLRKLETFVGNFYDLHDFNVYARRMLQGQGPHKYLLQVGSNGFLQSKFDEEDGLFSRRRYKCVVLTECNISSGKGEDALVLPNDIEYLSIQRCHDVSNLSHVSSLNTTNFLKECHIIRCDETECVLSTTSSSSSSSHTPLQSVEVLHLSNLQNLRVLIFRGEGDSLPPPPLPGTFSNLKTLDISFCPNIKKLFTLELLPNLEELDVRWCGQMEEIIAAKAQGEEGQQGKMCRSSNYSTVNHDDDAVFTITLPKLACLRLQDLLQLKSIVSGRGVMICDSLQTIYLHGCLKLKRLPLSLPMLNGQPSPPPSLQCIEIDIDCWESLEWDHPTTKDVLQSFISIV